MAARVALLVPGCDAPRLRRSHGGAHAEGDWNLSGVTRGVSRKSKAPPVRLEGLIRAWSVGSGGRIRTYDQVINSHPLYH